MAVGPSQTMSESPGRPRSFAFSTRNAVMAAIQVATLQTVLIVPGVLFLTSVLVSAGDPPQYELAHVAQRIVSWYTGRTWTLGVLLLLLPLAGLVAGCATLIHDWRGEIQIQPAARSSLAAIPAPFATLVVGWATLTSAEILAVVVLHMLAN